MNCNLQLPLRSKAGRVDAYLGDIVFRYIGPLPNNDGHVLSFLDADNAWVSHVVTDFALRNNFENVAQRLETWHNVFFDVRSGSGNVHCFPSKQAAEKSESRSLAKCELRSVMLGDELVELELLPLHVSGRVLSRVGLADSSDQYAWPAVVKARWMASLDNSIGQIWLGEA